jgi:hypothetical protein
MTATANNHLLLDCLRGVNDQATKASLEHLTEKEWLQLVGLAARHGVQPLLFDRLTNSPFPLAIPEEPLQELREAYLMNGLRNTLIYEELRQVLSALHQANLPVIVLKGAHLAQLAYGNIALRPMGDIDLLVKEEHLAAVSAKLRALGYASELAETEIKSWRNQNDHPRHIPSFVKPQSARIEIHWSIAICLYRPPPKGTPRRLGEARAVLVPTPNPSELGKLWQRARRVTLAEVNALVLSPEDDLLNLCMHMQNHYFNQGIRPLFDIAALIQSCQPMIDWNQLETRAREWSVSECVYMGLRLAKELAGAPVPLSTLQTLQSDNKDVWKVWFDSTMVFDAINPASGFKYAWHQLWSPEPLTVCLRSFFRAVFPLRIHMACYMAYHHARPLTRTIKYTCYATRWWDLLVRGAHCVWQAFAHKGIASKVQTSL